MASTATILHTMSDNDKIKVLFVCTGNSCRSQMAEGFLRKWAGDRIEVKSAGSHPADDVSRLSTEVMHQVGIDISGHYPKGFDTVKDELFDWVITLCDFARDFYPVFRSREGTAKTLHWSIEDPMTASNDPAIALAAYRETRDKLAKHIKEWLAEEIGMEVE